jgi:general nucleoside transport system permease protein
MIRVFGYRLVKRPSTNPLTELVAVLIALLIAFGVSAILIASAGVNVGEAMQALVRGSLGSRSAIAETIVQATPLILTGLAVTVAFRARLWNIGAEGQFFAGAMAAFYVASTFGNLPRAPMILFIFLGALIAGGIWGTIPALLKAKFGASEVIVTVMLNFVIQFVLSYLLGGPWQDPESAFLQTAKIPESAIFSRIFTGTRIHIGIFVAILAVFVIWFLLWKTTLGYEIRAFGINSIASNYKGISSLRTIVLAFAISGAIAALAGASEIVGLHGRLRLDISTGFGFTGIIVALLGRLHPVWVVVAALFMGALWNGSLAMQIASGVPIALAFVIRGVVLVALLAAETITQVQIRRCDE